MRKPLEFAKVGSAAVVLGSPEPTSIADLWTTLVPAYKSISYGPAIFKIHWDKDVVAQILGLSVKRAENRVRNYLRSDEITRVKSKLSKKSEASIRFGAAKTGFGYSGERGDFCLIAGVIRGRELTLYYRSLEMMGGFAFDLCLIAKLSYLLDIEWETVTFVSRKVFTFALKGNSNEKLYPKLLRIFQGN